MQAHSQIGKLPMQTFARGFLRIVNSEVLTFAYATLENFLCFLPCPAMDFRQASPNGWRKMPAELRCYFQRCMPVASSETGKGALSQGLGKRACELVYALAAQNEGAREGIMPPMLRCTFCVPLVTV